MSKIASSVALKRDFDLLKVLQVQDNMGLLDQGMISLCLFDIYRGVFAHPSKRVQSSVVSSEVQAAAKLSLLTYLLQKINYMDSLTENQPIDSGLKAFVGDLVTGIHQETVSDDKKSV